MKIIRIVAVFAGLLFAGSSHGQSKKPNVLILLADDLGYTDLGCYGSEIQTPNLDRLANQGLRFSQFYNTARCWPSRASLMSGYYAQQVRMDPQQKKGPTPWMKLLSHHLGASGYRAYHSGKWHIGVLPRVMADGGFHHSYNLTDQNRFFSPKTSYRRRQARCRRSIRSRAIMRPRTSRTTPFAVSRSTRKNTESNRSSRMSASHLRTFPCMPCPRTSPATRIAIWKAGTSFARIAMNARRRSASFHARCRPGKIRRPRWSTRRAISRPLGLARSRNRPLGRICPRIRKNTRR